jgi:uncharacterized protein GlcG (DUF336 family)
MKTTLLDAPILAAMIVAGIGARNQVSAQGASDQSKGTACSISAAVVQQIQNQLAPTVKQMNGGIFNPNRMWSAVVDRAGRLCSVIKVGDAWPGSRAIAIAKASTANDFSNDGLALSTANLYSATQPGGSLYGLNNSNPFNPEFLPLGEGIGEPPGGIITFGGGVALYSGGEVIGGLGLSGDSACADHTIAYRMRRAAKLDAIPGGVGFQGTDNILYDITPNQFGGTGVSAGGFGHPHCFPQDIASGDI